MTDSPNHTLTVAELIEVLKTYDQTLLVAVSDSEYYPEDIDDYSLQVWSIEHNPCWASNKEASYLVIH